MRILHVVKHVENAGNGIVNVCIDLACIQSKHGHEVAVASAGGDYEELLEKYNVKHFKLRQERNPFSFFSSLRKYTKITTKFKPEIVHTHMVTSLAIAYASKWINKASIISTVHNEFQKSSILMGFSDKVIAVSEAVAQSISKRGVPAHKISVVRNGTLGSPRTKPLGCYQAHSLQRPSISTVAGMNSRKGIRELIDAFEQISDEFPEAHLYLVGDGPERSQFEEIASQKPSAARIHFEGFQAEPQCYLLATDVFVLASRKDPCPLVIAEAREASCAIVASDVDGIPELLEQGKAGILVTPGSVDKIASAVKNLLRSQIVLQNAKTSASLNISYLTAMRVHYETLSIYERVK